MIDIVSEIFNELYTEVIKTYPEIYMASEVVKKPSSFPAVFVLEMDNRIYERTQDSSELENHATLMFEVNVFSNKANGAEKEVRAIANIIDGKFKDIGFTRIMSNPILNLEDPSVHRRVSRYKAVVSKENIVYRR